MILDSISDQYDDYETNSFVTSKQLIKILDARPQFKDKLLSVFNISEEELQIFQVGNSKYLVDALLDLDSRCTKIDIRVKLKDIHLKKMLEAEKSEFEIFNVAEPLILLNNKSDLLLTETAYSAKTDLLDLYNFSKFANYCRDKDFEDLLGHIKDYLNTKNSNNHEEKNLRIIHKNEDDKYYLRALTSVSGYRDFGINFSVFVAIVTLGKYVQNSKEDIYINSFKVNDSNVYISFALKNGVRVNDNISLSFNLILENDEIKRGAVAFNGVFKLKWEDNDNESEIFLKPDGLKKDGKNNPVDLLTFAHRGQVEDVFDKLKDLPEFIKYFVLQVSQDSKKIADIKHPNDVKTFIRDKVRNARKAEFQTYKPEILKRLMSMSVDNTFQLFELLRTVEDLFEHDDVVSLNFWRNKLYESLIKKQ